MDLILENARGIEHESEVTEYICSLPKGSIFYDLGSCVGAFALQACSLGLKVVAFEVEDANYNQLVRNYHLNNDQFEKDHYFKPIQIGIADKKGKIMLRVGQGGPGGHHKTLALDTFCASEGIIGRNTEEVNVNSLDNLIKEWDLPIPDYLKVDIDGSEYAFIQGAKKTLKKVKSMIIELYQESDYYQKIIDDLNKLGLYETSRGPTIDSGGLCNVVFTRK